MRRAGRGALALSGAKLYFLVLGLGQQIVLSWLLGDGYGALRGAQSPASITYNPLVTAGVQGMSRAVSRVSEEERPAAIRTGLVVHAWLSFVIALGFFALAPLLGSWLNSEYLVTSLQILSLVVLFYGIYAPFVGVLNGQRQFGRQALLDVLSATLRTVALVGFGWWFISRGTLKAVEGACWGFALVALLMVLVSIWVVGFGRRGPTRLRAREHLGFVLPVLGAQGVLNLLLQADTNTLRAFATRAAEASGREASAADALVGAYNAGQLFGFLPYQLLIGITFILFPMLATAHAREESDAVRRYVRAGMRVALLLVGLIVAIAAALSESLLRLVFPGQFADLGSRSMQVLCFGLGVFALFGVLTTVLNSLGRQWQGLLATLLALVCVLGMNLWWVSGTAFGEQLLLNTAWATSLGMLPGALLAALLVRRATGTLMSLAVGLRVLAAVVVVVGLGHQLPVLGRPLTVGAAAGLGVVYVGILWLLRELGAEDVRRVAAMLSRRRGSA